MCLANVYRRSGNAQEELLQEVALIRVDGERLLLRTLFGDERVITGRIKELDFVNSTVLIEVADKTKKRK